jgi:hypothetical protein
VTPPLIAVVGLDQSNLPIVPYHQTGLLEFGTRSSESNGSVSDTSQATLQRHGHCLKFISRPTSNAIGHIYAEVWISQNAEKVMQTQKAPVAVLFACFRRSRRFLEDLIEVLVESGPLRRPEGKGHWNNSVISDRHSDRHHIPRHEGPRCIHHETIEAVSFED